MESESSRLLAIAITQRQEWGLISIRRLPMRREAEQSEREYWNQLHQKEVERVRRQFPPTFSESMIEHFLGQKSYKLNEYQDEILQAAKRNDREFFIRLYRM